MYWLLSLLVLALDQLSKWLVQSKMTPYQSIHLVSGWFSLTFVKNRGAAFSMLYGQTGLLIAISLLVFTMVWFHRRQLTGYPGLFRIGLALALGGAAGNFADRIRLGYVVDFFEFPYWPVFNVADAGIVIGVGFIILGLLLEESRKRRQAGTQRERETSSEASCKGENL